MKTMLLLLAVATVGCAEAPAVNTAVDVLTLKRSADTPLGVESAKVALETLTPDTIDKHPELKMKLRWMEPDRAAPVVAGQQPPSKPVEGTVLLVPLPAFLLRIENQGTQAIDFAKAGFKLEDSTGKSFKLIPDGGEVATRVQNDLIGEYPGLSTLEAVMENVRATITKLSFLGKKTQVPPGGSWQGFLVFEMDVHDVGELDSYLQKVQKLTLKVDNVTVGGAPVTLLSTDLEKGPVKLTMSCPGGQPLVKKCKLPQ
jgi:hypothetical protein